MVLMVFMSDINGHVSRHIDGFDCAQDGMVWVKEILWEECC